MCVFDGRQHLRFRHLAGEPFDHQHGGLGSRHHQVEVAFFEFVERRKRHELAVYPAHANRSDRAAKRKRGNKQPGRRAVHREHVRIVLLIERQDDALDLNLVVITFRKQRPDRSIDESRRKDFTRGRSTFALDEPTRELARCRRPLTIVAGEREKIDSGSRGTTGHRIQDDRLAILAEHRRRGLLGQKTRFKRKNTLANLLLNANLHFSIPTLICVSAQRVTSTAITTVATQHIPRNPGQPRMAHTRSRPAKRKTLASYPEQIDRQGNTEPKPRDSGADRSPAFKRRQGTPSSDHQPPAAR